MEIEINVVEIDVNVNVVEVEINEIIKKHFCQGNRLQHKKHY